MLSDYRDKLIGMVEEKGIQKSQLSILQGLMKLRQICDSPAILNEDEKYPNHSIKLDELTREITENIGSHKALVFSQFLGMLSLIKENLTEAGIKFEYFDGSIFQSLSTGGGITYTVDSFTGDGTTTVFTMSEQESNAEYITVFVGSIYQQPTITYTVDGGYDITFTSAPPDGVPINVIHTNS